MLLNVYLCGWLVTTIGALVAVNRLSDRRRSRSLSLGSLAVLAGVNALAALAAAYAFGIAKNHPFVDGNKRTAFASIMVFLGLNGIDFAPRPEHVTAMILSLAAGEVSEQSLARWIRDNWPKSSCYSAFR